MERNVNDKFPMIIFGANYKWHRTPVQLDQMDGVPDPGVIEGLGLIVSRCSGKEPALLPKERDADQTRENV